MKFIKDLKDLGRKDYQLAGGKGANLGELIQMGCAVPNGFVFLTTAFEYFLKANQIPLKQNPKKIQSLIQKAVVPPAIVNAINKAFNSLKINKVAVRSSSTIEDSKSSTWAGQFETILNSNRKNLIENIKKCWSSIYSAQAISYRKKMNGSEGSMAVVIQEMIKSNCAGVVFSVHPVSQNRNEILIEAIRGCGEYLVSGKKTPDAYVITKNGAISDKNLSTGLQILKDNLIRLLAKKVYKIEKHFGIPMDIEWAIDKNKFWFLQARPITTLRKLKKILFDQQISWKLYLQRPFTLLGATLWHSWYLSHSYKKITGINANNALFFEEHRNVVRYYWEDQENKKSLEGIKNLVRNHFARYQEFLKYSFALNKRAERLLKGEEHIKSFNEAFAFFCDLSLFCAVLPRQSLPIVIKIWPKQKNAIESCKKLRMLSYYPKISEHILIPLAIKKIENLGIRNVEKKVNLMTLQELIHGDVSKVKRREKAVNEGKYFIYQCLNGKESVEWISLKRMHDLVLDMEKISSNNHKLIKGNVAFPGNVRGRARVILDHGDGVKFLKGDILVTICATPMMMSLIQKASAIVTNEGGISCHAAIISRELKKPCVMCTKNATTLIKDGDWIEVDAERGIVRIVK